MPWGPSSLQLTCLLILLPVGRWAGTEELNARLMVLAGSWGSGDDVPSLLACARPGQEHIQRVSSVQGRSGAAALAGAGLAPVPRLHARTCCLCAAVFTPDNGICSGVCQGYAAASLWSLPFPL